MTRKILLIEDDLNPTKEVENEIRKILDEFRKILKKFGEITEVYSYKAALQQMQKGNFFLAVVDIVLPESDEDFSSQEERWGKELIKKLRKKGTPVIGISNKTDFTTVSELLNPPYEIVAVIHKKCEKRHINRFEEYVKSVFQPRKRNRYCSYANSLCIKTFLFRGNRSIFAISSENKKGIVDLIYETFKTNYSIHPWTYCSSVAGCIFCDHVCPKIYGNNIILAEISDMNPNVFFEVGFAFGLGRTVVLLKRKEGSGNIDRGILRDIKYNPYSNINDIEKILDDIQISDFQTYDTPQIFENIPNFQCPQNRRKEGLFIISWTCSTLINLISGLRHIKIKGNNLISVVKQSINAKGIVFDLECVDKIHNAQLFLIAGICVSQGVPVGFFIKERNKPPIDVHQLSLKNKEEVKSFLKECPL